MSLKLHQRPALEAGDPNQFALRVEFVPNLDPGYATPEEDLSWGRLQLWAGGRNLCEHVDRGEVRKSVEWYLLPLLEWLAGSWDYLLHEQRPPVSNAGDTAWQSLAETNQPERFNRFDGWDVEADEAHVTWTARHCLRTARFGGLFPDVVIRRWREEVELSWGESPIAGAPADFRFLHGVGAARLAPEAVAQPLHAVLREAVEALVDAQPQAERLVALQKQVRGIQNAGRQLQRTALLAGLGQSSDECLKRWEGLRKKLEGKLSGIQGSLKEWFEPAGDNTLCISGSCEAAVMFGSASPTLTEKDILTLAVHLVKSADKKPSATWKTLADDPQALCPTESPWSDGYRLAEEWSAKAGIRHKREGSVDVEGHLEKLGVGVTDIDLEDSGTAGLAIHPEKGGPQIFVNRRNPKCEFPSGRRFILAHELCHLLHDREHGRNLALISGPWAPRDLEKRSNAFAAAFLMPPALLRKGLHAEANDLEFAGLLALAKRLQVSPDALAHHLENCGLISESTRDGLLAQLVNRPESSRKTKPSSSRKPAKD